MGAKQRFCEELRRKNITGARIAKDLGYNVNRTREWVTGKTLPRNCDQVNRVADAYKLDKRYIFTGVRGNGGLICITVGDAKTTASERLSMMLNTLDLDNATIGKDLGVPTERVRRWRAGECGPKDLDMFVDICERYGFDTFWVATGWRKYDKRTKKPIC